MSSKHRGDSFHNDTGERMTDRIYREDPALLGFMENEDSGRNPQGGPKRTSSGGTGGKGTGGYGCLFEIIIWIILFVIVIRIESDIPFFILDAAVLIRFFTYGLTERKGKNTAKEESLQSLNKTADGQKPAVQRGHAEKQPVEAVKIKHRKLIIAGLAAAVVIIFSVLAAGHARKEQALDAARQIAIEQQISTTFDRAGLIRDKKEFGAELVRLIRWAEEVSLKIDHAYGHQAGDNWENAILYEQVNGFKDRKMLEKDAREAEWERIHEDLEKELLSSLSSIYETAGEYNGRLPSQQAVIQYYNKKKNFQGLLSSLAQAEEGNFEEVYSKEAPWLSTYYSNKEQEWVCMDLLCILWPDQMLECGRKRLQDAIDKVDERNLSESNQLLEDARKDTSFLQDRYGFELPELKTADDLSEKLVQMYREEKAAEEEERKQRIQDQLDAIYSSGSHTYSDPVDPDMHDIEGYYDDYRDEYDDEDDAYEGFLDDEDAWDDY